MTFPKVYSKLSEEYSDFNQDPAHGISENFLKINIFYEALRYTKYTQAPSYGTVQFISDVGK